jgi:aminoglycoside phosphotransferase (APT) family kinase protein
VQRLAAGLTGPLARCEAGPLVPTHGDFQPKNILVAGSRVTVIDFDRFALAHPARDLGHFVAQSTTMAAARTGSLSTTRAWNDAFLDEYRRHAPPEALVALNVFTARSLLEILYYRLVVRPVRDPGFVPAWVDECERCLEATP